MTNDPMTNKPLPHNDEAERLILGSILMDNAVIDQVAALTASDFYVPFNRKVFEAMNALSRAAKPIDPMLIGEEIRKVDSLEAIGGVAAITNLTYGIPLAVNVKEYVETVRQKARLREMARTCARMAAAALADDEDFETLITKAQAEINDVCLKAETAGGGQQRFVSLAQVLKTDVARTLENLRYGRSDRIKTGFDAIDTAIGGGVSPSDVLLLVADTGQGKSALALQMASQIAEQGVPVAFLAGEMTNGENVNRLLSQKSQMPNLNWLRKISDQEYVYLFDWSEAIKDHPLYFDDRTSDLQSLGAHLRSLVRRQGIKVLVIDYIQLLKVERLDRRARHERIAEASQEVKRLANELGIAIIEVAQFNRVGAKSAEATLHDLEGSGQLEKDASFVFILELAEKEQYDTVSRKFWPAKIRIVKGRNAGLGTVEGKFYGRSIRFEFDEVQA